MEPGLEDFTKDELATFLRRTFPADLADKIISHELDGKLFGTLIRTPDQYFLLSSMEFTIKEVLQFQTVYPITKNHNDTPTRKSIKASTPMTNRLLKRQKNLQQKQLRAEVKRKWSDDRLPASFADKENKEELDAFVDWLHGESTTSLRMLEHMGKNKIRSSILTIVHERRRNIKEMRKSGSQNQVAAEQVRRQLDMNEDERENQKDKLPQATCANKRKTCSPHVSPVKRKCSQRKLTPKKPKKTLAIFNPQIVKTIRHKFQSESQNQILDTVSVSQTSPVLFPEVREEIDDDPTKSLSDVSVASNKSTCYSPSSPEYSLQHETQDTQAVSRVHASANEVVRQFKLDDISRHEHLILARLTLGKFNRDKIKEKCEKYDIPVPAREKKVTDECVEFAKGMLRAKKLTILNRPVETVDDIFIPVYE
ncbi:uncharacterized protein [Clytia hemisphaerica]|uniref:Uncharacterized protein n=1 Tax=Clytia hemisphaerica TaxID=252671 RepID=A0A7M5XAN1_9CNID|eukprot:TCONS_00038910-protein